MVRSLFRLPLLCGVLFMFVTLTGCDSLNGADDGLSELNFELSSLIEEAAEGQGLQAFILPAHTNLYALPQDRLNPLTPEKVKLGTMLFHETALGVKSAKPEGFQTYVCASCHPAHSGFFAGVAQGIADGGMGFGVAGEGRTINPAYGPEDIDALPIRVPTNLNVAYSTNVLWNGEFGAGGVNVGTEDRWTDDVPARFNRLGFPGVETQAIGGLELHRMSVEESMVSQSADYRRMFDEAFPEYPVDKRISQITAGLAIAAYERTLVTTEAPFQKWLKGDRRAMDAQELRGAILFFGKAECATCHKGPALNSMEFHAMGMNDLSGPGVVTSFDADHRVHLGRGGFTGRNEDMYRFKTPQLYNLVDARFYGHGSSFRTVREVVEYKNQGVPQNSRVPRNRLSENFKPLYLTDQEVTDLTRFIETALLDPTIMNYFPTKVMSGNCFPNNDGQSRQDMNCL